MFRTTRHHRLLDRGATTEERWVQLPGDGLVVGPSLSVTRAITIGARPADVWPWIAQLGQGRGGFYSYDALENLVGCDIHSADAIVDAWQDVAVGDPFHLHPDMALAVAVVEPGRALVVRGGEAAPLEDFTWAFVLRDVDGEPARTRLLVRERYASDRWWGSLVVEPVAAVSTVMSARMLRGIRDRAEGRARRPARGAA
jgi:hypothetical protein